MSVIMHYKERVAKRGGDYNRFRVEGVIYKVASILAGERSPKCTGILLCGNAGTGKTTLIGAVVDAMSEIKGSRFFRDYSRALGRQEWYLSMQSFVAGAYANSVATAPDSEWARSVRTAIVVMGDDIGEEPTEVNSFGTVVYPVRDVINQRYTDPRLFTILASNLTPSELGGKYGARVGDRLAEMCEVITMTGESFRRSNK